MTRAQPDTEELLRRTGHGDRDARGAVLGRHRQRLRRMVTLRMDPRLAARVDASDVVQETLAEAERRLDAYVRERPLPFYPWLRQLAWERLVEQHRRHVRAGKRSVAREESLALDLSGQSVQVLADRLLDRGASPSANLQKKELRARVRAALGALDEQDREILLLRYLEQMPAREVGALLELSEEAAKKRALRALQRLRDLLKGEQPES